MCLVGGVNPFNAIQCYQRHLGALALSPERQSAQMSKITNGGLDQYGKV